jgi:hypothetical protein
MSGGGCLESMELLNLFFTTAIVLNDGHDVLARLAAGDDIAEVARDHAEKLGRPEFADEFRKVIKGWPSLHLEAVQQVLQWALGKLDTDERITISWKGDADSPETVTRFELRDHQMLIEFAHPPRYFAQAGAPAVAEA